MLKKLLFVFSFVNLHALSVLAEEVNMSALKSEYVRPKEIPYLEDNPYTKEKEDLGRLLFFDPRLSKSNMVSCASCHNPSFSWGDALPLSVGHQHKTLTRRSPTILNLAWSERIMWDGRATHYEGQAMGPIENEDEMATKIDGPEGVIAKLKRIEGYKNYFKKAFPKDKDPITAQNMSQAIAIFERSVVSGPAPFDKWIEGDEAAISNKAKQGFVLFNSKARCVLCHSGWNFSDGSFHDIGLKSTDIGRGKFLPKLKTQQHAFKTPGLRNISLRAPYMHDGSEQTLEQVVEFYNRGGDTKRESLSSLIKPLKLSKSEVKSIVEFLNTLNGNDPQQIFPILPR